MVTSCKIVAVMAGTALAVCTVPNLVNAEEMKLQTKVPEILSSIDADHYQSLNPGEMAKTVGTHDGFGTHFVYNPFSNTYYWWTGYWPASGLIQAGIF